MIYTRTRDIAYITLAKVKRLKTGKCLKNIALAGDASQAKNNTKDCSSNISKPDFAIFNKNGIRSNVIEDRINFTLNIFKGYILLLKYTTNNKLIT